MNKFNLRKLSLIVLSLFSTQIFASELKDKFLQATQAREGLYQKVSGPEACLEGRVRILDFDRDLTLMVGAQPLILGIGKENQLVKEPACTTRSSARFEGHRVTGERTQRCKSLEIRFVTDARFTAEGLIYKRLVFSGKTLKSEQKCILKFQAEEASN